MKRISVPLYHIIKTGKFKWGKVEAQAYTNLLFLFALQLKNHIHDPKKPLILYADTSALESGLSAFQFDKDKLALQLISTKSVLLPLSVRRQAAVFRECFGVEALLSMAKPYLFQTQSPHNFLLNDASSIGYLSRMKTFSSFLQNLSEHLSLYPSLTTIHTPGRCLTLSDLLSRTNDNVIVSNPDTSLSKEHAELAPALKDLQPGAILTYKELLKLLSHQHAGELFDVSDSDSRYVMRVPWDLYTNDSQIFTSEAEFILGSLVSSINPNLALNLPTFKDLFRIKNKRFRTKAEKLKFLQTCVTAFKDLPYNPSQLQKLVSFLQDQAKKANLSDKISFPDIQANICVMQPSACQCVECSGVVHASGIHNTIRDPADMVDKMLPFLTTLNDLHINDLSKTF